MSERQPHGLAGEAEDSGPVGCEPSMVSAANGGVDATLFDGNMASEIGTPEDLAAEVDQLFARPYNILEFRAAAQRAGAQIERRHHDLIRALFAYAASYPDRVVQISDLAGATSLSTKKMVRRYEEAVAATAGVGEGLSELLPPTNLDHRVGRLIIAALKGNYGGLDNEAIACLVRTTLDSVHKYGSRLRRKGSL